MSSAPTIGSMIPSTGPVNGGNIVTLTVTYSVSSNFMILFGNTQITNFIAVQYSGPSAIISFLAPIGVVGNINVYVTSSDGTSNASFYIYTDNLPNITSISPSNGNVGTQVTVNGNGFFGGFYVSSNLNGFSENNGNFGTGNNPYQSVVTSLTINGLTINAQNNNGGYNYIVTNDNQINIINIPYNPSGTYDIIVNTLYGSTPITSNDQFTYVSQPFSITAITPDCGSSDGGQVVTISGVGFDKYNDIVNLSNYNGNNPNTLTVLFGNLPASFIVVNTDIVATLPSNVFRKKNIEVTIMNNTQKITFPFTYHDTLPKIDEICPSKAQAGDIVIIKGENFTNVMCVWFGNKKAEIISIEGTNKIRVVVPKGCDKVKVVVNRTNVDIHSPLINASNNSPVLLPFDNIKYIMFSSDTDNKKCIFKYK
jgi:hypothetical protein